MNSKPNGSLFFAPTLPAEETIVVAAIWGFVELRASLLLSVVSNLVASFLPSGARRLTRQLTSIKTSAHCVCSDAAKTRRPF